MHGDAGVLHVGACDTDSPCCDRRSSQSRRFGAVTDEPDCDEPDCDDPDCDDPDCDDVFIPSSVRVVEIQARDQRYGWGGSTVKVNVPVR